MESIGKTAVGVIVAVVVLNALSYLGEKIMPLEKKQEAPCGCSEEGYLNFGQNV